MKIYILFLSLFVLLKADVNECILGIRIYPYKYVGAT